MTINGVEGTLFAVWAPDARAVSVVGEFNMWDERLHHMELHGESGIFELFIPGTWEGAVYKYEIVTRMGERLFKTDPYGNYCELRPGNASRITRLDTYKWHDTAYMKKRDAKTREEREREPMTIYEAHLASWKKKIEDDLNSESSYVYQQLMSRLQTQKIVIEHLDTTPQEMYEDDDNQIC